MTVQRRIWRCRSWSVLGILILIVTLAQPALAHETDEAHIEPEVILLAAAIPVAIIVIGGVVAFFALRAQAHEADPAAESAGSSVDDTSASGQESSGNAAGPRA